MIYDQHKSIVFQTGRRGHIKQTTHNSLHLSKNNIRQERKGKLHTLFEHIHENVPVTCIPLMPLLYSKTGVYRCILVRHEYGIFSMDLEVRYKVFFLMDSCREDIVIHDSG